MANAYKNRIPPITTVKGTIHRIYVLMENKKSVCHKTVVLAHQNKVLWNENRTSHPLAADILNMDNELFAKVSSDMLDVYNDAKRGTLSAWSWSSHVLIQYKAYSVVIDNFA